MSRPGSTTSDPAGFETAGSQPSKFFVRLMLLALLLIGLCLRVCALPGRYEVRDVDECGYASGGLALLEGTLPAYKNGPGGTLFWPVWARASLQTAYHVIRPNAEERALPMTLRPFAAMDRALFENYRDLSGARNLCLYLALLVSLVSIVAGWKYGYRLASGGGLPGLTTTPDHNAGIGGALLLAGITAFLPLYIEYSAMSRPYAISWSLGVIMLAIAGCARRWRLMGTVIFAGLAIGSRVETLLLLPIVVWEFWRRPEPGSFLLTLVKLALGTFAASIVVAPWIPTTLVGLMRAVATIQVVSTADKAVPYLTTLKDLCFSQGLGLVAFAAFAGIAAVLIGGTRTTAGKLRNGLLALYFVILAFSILKSTGFGLHHKGPQIIGVAVAAALAFALRGPHSRTLAGQLITALLLLSIPLAKSSYFSFSLLKSPDYGDRANEWLTKYIPPGTPVYVPVTVRTPLPTPASADRIWEVTANPTAYIKKFQSGMQRFKVNDNPLPIPRAMSVENLVQEAGNRRRYFLLGSQASFPEPRYDLTVYCSPIFTEAHKGEAWHRTGGVLFHRPMLDGEISDMPAPTFVLKGRMPGNDLYIYVSPELLQQLAPEGRQLQ